MANKQYQKGVRLEREIVSGFKKAGAKAMRTAGSHGWADVIAVVTPEQVMGISGVFDSFEQTTDDQAVTKFVRIGKKYTDTLYVQVYKNRFEDETLFAIQAKRKAVKHG